MRPAWHTLENAGDIPSPALLVYPERIEENLRRMIRLAGGTERLRPHIKTHKMPEIVRLQLSLGIRKFKCATIAEAEMAAQAGAGDVLLAYQPVGPNAQRLLRLAQCFPQTRFSAVADDETCIRDLSKAWSAARSTLELLLDIDCGMRRTGVLPGPEAVALYKLIESLPGLRAGGLHVYDGHLHQSDPEARSAACEAAFAPITKLVAALTGEGLAVPRIIAGGTPTFPWHAKRGQVECSPGTCVLWDYGYATGLPDLDFLSSALVLARVVSKPGPHRLCLDLGHKAVAAENPHPRVHWIDLPDAKAVAHSEEHLVVETEQAADFPVGRAVFGIPWHICPTVALYSEAITVQNGRAAECWKITGRERTLTI